MNLTLLKFSSEDCGTCHRMSHYDSIVSEELGLIFVSVLLQDVQIYRKYRNILLSKYPKKEGMGWPTYLLVKEPDGDFEVIGEVKGGMPKGEFRKRLSTILSNNENNQ